MQILTEHLKLADGIVKICCILKDAIFNLIFELLDLIPKNSSQNLVCFSHNWRCIGYICHSFARKYRLGQTFETKSYTHIFLKIYTPSQSHVQAVLFSAKELQPMQGLQQICQNNTQQTGISVCLSVLILWLKVLDNIQDHM